MKNFILGLFSVLFILSCSSDKVVNGGLVQKRKYRQGFYLGHKAKKQNQHALAINKNTIAPTESTPMKPSEPVIGNAEINTELEASANQSVYLNNKKTKNTPQIKKDEKLQITKTKKKDLVKGDPAPKPKKSLYQIFSYISIISGIAAVIGIILATLLANPPVIFAYIGIFGASLFIIAYIFSLLLATKEELTQPRKKKNKKNKDNPNPANSNTYSTFSLGLGIVQVLMSLFAFISYDSYDNSALLPNLLSAFLFLFGYIFTIPAIISGILGYKIEEKKKRALMGIFLTLAFILSSVAFILIL
jgi:hypothetical protein